MVNSFWLRTAVAVLALSIPATAQRDPLFKTEILPVLEKNCVQCHGEKQKMAKLDLSSFTGMMEGSSSGPVIAPGKPERHVGGVSAVVLYRAIPVPGVPA